MDTVEIARELRGLRGKCKYTLRYVGDRLGVHRETVRKYEKDVKGMPLNMFNDLLQIYGETITIFFTKLYAKWHD
ncbi:MAG: helix-turn-helix transcriptional regulator [Bacilli bacterium]|jgi:predicted transcriptional regulator